MRSPSGYEFFEHTADVGMRAWGPELGAALHAAMQALMELLTGGSFTSQGARQYAIELTAESTDDLVVAWLQELLLRFELEQLVARDCTFQHLTTTRLAANVSAERCDPSAERLGREVKAITYHQLRVELTPERCRIEVIVDV